MTIGPDRGSTADATGASATSASSALVPYDPEKFERDQARVAKGFWQKLRRVAAKLPFLEELIAAYYCAVDPATPLQVKAILMGALAYFVLPADMIPDFFAWIGYSDDAAVLYAAVRAVATHITPAHRERAKSFIANRLRS
ncbi:MAG: YkvA family protein [Pseudomonadota bacterium]